MAILYQNINANNARFPTPKQKPIQRNVFPNDLRTNGRDFCMYMQFKEYNFTDMLPNTVPFGSQLANILNNNVTPFIQSNLQKLAKYFNTDISNLTLTTSQNIGPIVLPLPKSINDITTLNWSDQSVIEKIPVARGVGEFIATTSFMSGLTINPFLFMFFQRPNFKEFTFKWTLTPNTEAESRTIIKIINSCKKASLPTKTGFGFLLQYPQVVQIDIFPDELKQHMSFKPCAITSVQADYTAAGNPSFFKGTNLPTVISLTLSLKEIELWDSSEIYGVS
jgi:hypothetical protein